MRNAILIAALVVSTAVAAFVGGRASAGDEPKEEKPVKALRLRLPVAGDVGQGTVIEELWFPDAKVACSVMFDTGRAGARRATAGRSEEAPIWFTGMAGLDLEPIPSEAIEVPAGFLRQVLDLADASARAEHLAGEVAKRGLELGTFREIPAK